jgi:hypothetical protein
MAAIAALAAVVMAGGLIALGWHTIRGSDEPAPLPHTPSASDPITDTARGYDWIVKAMAECEEEAKLSPDTMRFLIVPVTAAGASLPGWSPSSIGTIGEVAVLLHTTDTMIGLRNGALALYQGPLTFAVSDPATNITYKWKPAVGVSELKAREIASTRLTLGLEIPDRGKTIEWGPTITLRKGACYWINPLLRAGNG